MRLVLRGIAWLVMLPVLLAVTILCSTVGVFVACVALMFDILYYAKSGYWDGETLWNLWDEYTDFLEFVWTD